MHRHPFTKFRAWNRKTIQNSADASFHDNLFTMTPASSSLQGPLNESQGIQAFFPLDLPIR